MTLTRNEQRIMQVAHLGLTRRRRAIVLEMHHKAFISAYSRLKKKVQDEHKTERLQDRRRHLRFPLHLPVQLGIRNEKPSKPAKMVNISSRAILVKTSLSITTGQRVTMAID